MAHRLWLSVYSFVVLNQDLIPDSYEGNVVIGIQEQSNTTTRIQCHEINFQNKLNLSVY